MTIYILKRLLSAVPVMLVVATVVFLILRLTPGDPASVMLGPQATTEQVQALRAEMGLDRPLFVQLASWYVRLAQGDLGNSIYLNRTVSAALVDRLEPTALLTALALLITALIGVPAGIVSAVRAGSWLDQAAMGMAVLGASMPDFWFGLNLILLFSITLSWLPAAGYAPLSTGAWESLQYLILPAVTLGFIQAAPLARMVRASMIDVLQDDYVRTARSKGLREGKVILRHAFRNALLPALTQLGITAAILMGSAVVIETVFTIPGVGRLIISSVLRRDYPVVQGAVLMIALAYVMLNILVDVIYVYIDPRVRYG
jgi:peptide/nickel transport system permease protein